MGIAGLLPALKPIHKVKHLSDFAGKTIAIDAYVWLHKGVFACATELATGKPTSKYVKYAMERIRLLRHHNIEPYVVFDGGPLPAKKGTEVERKMKRDENLSKANNLAAQGKHTQAREFYVKCVDVTPQMAFQLIKALRSESVRYVVAPYEADAQMAYLERMGIVDAVLTEDSDLLVFGCKNVLYKLDTVARTVVSISRSDFASVHDSNSISLVGWSDRQFRAMAILAGCDYLPSIPGVGLKTACAMLRKWKTMEQAIRMFLLEGKKTVPRNYAEMAKLAEKCFCHQRVYDPRQERLVHLTDINEQEWTKDADEFVGCDLEPNIAKKVALGEVDPITLLPMEDINPSFSPAEPRVLRVIPQNTPVQARSEKRQDKGKQKEKVASNGGIMAFFGPKPAIPPRSPKRKVIAGKASGKRTLADIMDQEIAAKKRHRADDMESRFFGAAPATGPSQRKQPVILLVDEDDLEEEVEDIDSAVAQGGESSQLSVEEQVEDVEQEDGYESPSGSAIQDSENLSSPIRARRNSFEFGADVLSSPVELIKKPSRAIVETVIVPRSPSPPVDLRNAFCDESQVGTVFKQDEDAADSQPSPPDPSPDSSESNPSQADEAEYLTDPEEHATRAHAARNQCVAAGWRERWSLGAGAVPPLRRSDTNVTPAGRHKAIRVHPYTRQSPVADLQQKGRRSLPTAVNTFKGTFDADALNENEALQRRSRLEHFRCPA